MNAKKCWPDSANKTNDELATDLAALCRSLIRTIELSRTYLVCHDHAMTANELDEDLRKTDTLRGTLGHTEFLFEYSADSFVTKLKPGITNFSRLKCSLTTNWKRKTNIDG